jgi:hypothetical protein
MRRLLLTLMRVSLLALFLLKALPSEAVAQDGRLIGTVTEADTGEPIPGVTVVLVGTRQGVATDAEGRYALIGIQPGTYTVRFSYVGYATRLVEGVRILAAQTTSLSAELAEEVAVGEEVIVDATRPVVDQNQISSIATVTSDEIARLPVTELSEVIARTSNSYEGFVRGSRRFETRTIVEGVDVSDAFYQLQGSAAGAYGGQTYWNTNKSDQTEASLFSLNPEGVAEVSVNTGAVDPRFASASGGVVSVTLQEGRGPLTGSFSARIAPRINRPGPDSLDFYFDADRYLAERQQLLQDPDPVRQARAARYTWTPDTYRHAEDPEMDFRASLGGSITEAWTFHANGQFFQTHGFMPNEFRKRIGGQLRSTYILSDRTRITAVGIVEDRGLFSGWTNRSYQEIWRFNLDGVAENDGGSYMGTVRLNHVLNNTSYVTAQVFTSGQRTRYGYTDDGGNFLDFFHAQVIRDNIGLPGDRSKRFYHQFSDSETDTGLILPGGQRYKLENPVVYSEDARSVATGIRLDYANQITTDHFFQIGSEFKLRSFGYDETYGVDGAGFTLNPVEEPFIPRQWTRNPWELSFYGSHRMEFGGLIVNLGLRSDIIDRDTEHFADYFQPFRRDTITVVNTMADGTEHTRNLARNFADRGESVPLDVFFNPSIGVSHPIGERAAMYFSYARSRQLAPYSQLYQMYDGNHSNSRFFNLSDPAQDPITSNNYEVGVQWEFMPDWGVDINAYMRSIDNYGRIGITTVTRNQISGMPTHNVFTTSFGYAESRGIELVLRRRPLALGRDVSLGVTASYTFGTVEQAYNVGGVNQTEFLFDADAPDAIPPFNSVREFRHFVQNVRGGSTLASGYDRTHRGVIRAVSSLPYNFTLGLTGSFESGFLYERAIGGDQRDRELLTGPANHQIDVRLENQITLAGRFGIDLFVDIRNLTNAMNVVAFENFSVDGPARFQRTGIPGQVLVSPDGTTLYGPARNLYFGTRVRF